ncbi:MAG: hypothetical protein ABSB26_08855 [Nitrososphaerales archaeon]|jgi:hypothetical protein
MRNEAFAFIGVILVVVSGMAGYYVGSSFGHGTTVTTVSFVPEACASHVEAPNVSGTIQVFQVKPASIGVICVNYQFSSTGNFSTTLYGGHSPVCMTKNETNNQYGVSCDIELTPSIPWFYHQSGQNVTVTYLVQSDKNATGVYWFGGPCVEIMIPFGIGKLPTHLTYPFPILFCPYFPDDPSGVTVTGITDMTVALVPYE